MAAGGSSKFEAEVAKYLEVGTAIKAIGAEKLVLGFCEVKSKKNADFATMKELKGTTGYKERKEAKSGLTVTEQAGELGESGKGAILQNAAEFKIFTAVPGTVTNPKVNFAFICRAAGLAFEEGELLHMIPVSPAVEILSTTTEFSFAAKELTFEVL